MASPMFLSMAGPDGTKVGTDLSIQMAVLLNPVSGVACIPPSQVLIFRFAALLDFGPEMWDRFIVV
jgi:hypothetical protein